MGTKLSFVAFDLETTGFSIDDCVTVVGLVLPFGCRVFCNTDGHSPQNLEQTIQEQIDEHIVLTTHSDEHTLLQALEVFAAERLANEDICLVAYNGERYRGGFDLPFLRTRSVIHNIAWPFVDLAYADLQPIIESRFNTIIPDTNSNANEEDTEEIADLCGAYDALIDDGFAELDPFDQSSEAVIAFENADFEPIILHNVADILRTQALADMADQYCPTSDFQLKSLTPPSRDSNLS